MEVYNDIIANVLKRGQPKQSRGAWTQSMFNVNYEIDLNYGFPLMTTKKMNWSHIVAENLWFLSGERSIDFLRHYGIKFWDDWADDDGMVPSAYGEFWRNFGVVDQVNRAINLLKQDRYTRRAVVSAWDPSNAAFSKLPPCHVMWVLNTQKHGTEDRLCLHLTQRSADLALGVPYNIAGYAFILHLMSRFTGIPVGTFAHSIVDAHVYTDPKCDHRNGLSWQMQQKSHPLPKLMIDSSIRDLVDVERLIEKRPPMDELLDIFKLEDYKAGPVIRFPVWV